MSIGEDEEQKGKENVNKDCLGKMWDYLNTRSKDPSGRFRKMHESQFAFYRKCTLVTLVVTFYFLTFFLPYMAGFFDLVSQTRLFFPVTVSILGQTHRFIAPNYDDFMKAVSNLGVLTQTSQITDGLSCVMDDTGSYYSFLSPSSPHWYIFLALSFITMGNNHAI